MGAALERFARWLTQFELSIGIIAIMVGLLELLSLEGMLLIFGGLVLAASGMRSVPSIGGPLARLVSALTPFRLIIGLSLLLVGILSVVPLLLNVPASLTVD